MYGDIPPQIANLTRLQVLDLNNNIDMRIESLEWVSHLSSLRRLDLSQIDLRGATDLVQRLNEVPSLTNLRLSACFLQNITNPSSFNSVINSSASLVILDLSDNNLSTSIYQWLFNFVHSLVHLDISYGNLEGYSPEAFGKMTALTYLDLSLNQLNGTIPEAFGKMTILGILT